VLQFTREGVNRGERTLYTTLSESRADLNHSASFHGISPENFEIVELLPPEGDLLPAQQYAVFHPSRRGT
jgi:circadian clock protein KaiC